MTTRQRWTLVCTVIGSGAVFLDGTIVNVGAQAHRPGAARRRSVGVLEGQAYIVGGYLAVLAALLILAGALSDHYGRRRVYAIGLTGFAATSALCGLAPTLEWLVVFRLAQGAAGALLIPGSLALITHAFDGARTRPGVRHLGGVDLGADRRSARSSAAVLVDTLGWRVAFLINVPLLGFALWATLTHVQESRDTETTGRFDWLGAIVAALAVGGLAFGVDPRPGQRVGGPRGLGLDRDRRRRARRLPDPDGPPTEPARPARRSSARAAFTTINLSTFFIYGALYVTFFYQAVVLQGVLGYTALGAGSVGLPSGVMLALLSTRIGTHRRARSARAASSIAGPIADGARAPLARPAAGRLRAVEGRRSATRRASSRRRRR